MNSDEVFQLFRQTGALLEGHFVLRSGLHSRQFFQCAMLLQYPRVASRIHEALAEKVKGVEADSVISPAMGGILVGHDLGRHLDKRHIFAEKDQGVLKVRRFEIRKGERFIVAEDVVTTGSAVQETCAIVRNAGGVVAAVACIVDRSSGREPDFGAPFVSLLKLNVETFAADALPPDLAAIPAFKPGSK
jgi:orotate phosphoribosyltransferase